ncbi:YggS family pyridoxal phosphate enzyme [Corynebacterium xerosis]|uniref:YggS family pyridoxal phosphate enzyme n=1 Tax=Corynebacterium xerosis TaxID=1725 RepID=UPI000EB27938|nr:YggS family pyridoxal phosphate enzyme [Corynebacterium xerosis]AYJ33377.1 YggS family pyridoxal phosphate enzyme [Corynebacterium xerosis]
MEHNESTGPVPASPSPTDPRDSADPAGASVPADPAVVTARHGAIRARIDDAARAAGRDPAEIRLLPVSKTVPADAMLVDWPALRDAGCLTLAENRVQEAAAKAEFFAAAAATAAAGNGAAADSPAVAPLPRWAVIGPLQTNKAGQLAAFADEFQALDRPKVAAALQRRLADGGASRTGSGNGGGDGDGAGNLGRTLDVLIQVNTSNEPQKAGIAPSEVAAFVEQFGPDGPYPNLRLRGFMTMAMIADPSSPDGDTDVRRCFADLRGLRDGLAPNVPDGVTLDELSMGMSGDFELAIAEGATTVRVGRAIFGERPKP